VAPASYGIGAEEQAARAARVAELRAVLAQTPSYERVMSRGIAAPADKRCSTSHWAAPHRAQSHPRRSHAR